jgi:hypothetical protein
MILARVPASRLLRSRQAWLSFGGWSAFLLVSLLLQRRGGAPHVVDHALDLYATLAVPFLVSALVGAAVGEESLPAAGRPLVALGASRARVAFTTVLVTMAASALVSGVLAAVVVAAGHGPDDPPLLADARQTLGVGALAAAAYAAYFMVGASLAGGVWGRGLFLVLDWIIGSGDGFGALLTPRAHLGNLLGGDAPFDALPWESALALATLAVVFSALAVRRASRALV